MFQTSTHLKLLYISGASASPAMGQVVFYSSSQFCYMGLLYARPNSASVVVMLYSFNKFCNMGLLYPRAASAKGEVMF